MLKITQCDFEKNKNISDKKISFDSVAILKSGFHLNLSLCVEQNFQKTKYTQYMCIHIFTSIAALVTQMSVIWFVYYEANRS